MDIVVEVAEPPSAISYCRYTIITITPHRAIIYLRSFRLAFEDKHHHQAM
jgi:hypothetical protein